MMRAPDFAPNQTFWGHFPLINNIFLFLACIIGENAFRMIILHHSYSTKKMTDSCLEAYI